MSVFGKILCPLATVFPFFFGNRIFYICFLEQEITGIGNIGKDLLDAGIAPVIAMPSFDALRRKLPSCLNP
jgi:hypothetical protein